MDKFVTDKGRRILELLKEDRFNRLSEYYDMFCGNFQFDLDTMMYLIDEIDEWIKVNEDFFIYHQHIVDYEGRDWFLTNWK